ncbi:MAG TPA: hypothetical protein VFO85_14410, partial [Vicinamibacteria bacterium]|nr:hypothetical protein [Vicinamibacteria bacterium]
MNAEAPKTPPARKPVRLWPGLVAAALLVLFKLAVPVLGPGSPPFALLGGLVGGAVIFLWWVFFSRAPWSERLGSVVLIAAALFATSRLVHESIGNAGGGLMLPVVALPVVGLVLVAWAAAARRLADGPRRATLAASILVACGGWALLRTGGVTGKGDADLHWRWTTTPEERLLAQAADEPSAPPAPEA